MNPFQLHPNPYSGPILLIVMAFLGLAAQMNHYFCKQLAFFLIVRDFIWKLTLSSLGPNLTNTLVICSGVVTFLQLGQWQAWMVTIFSMGHL